MKSTALKLNAFLIAPLILAQPATTFAGDLKVHVTGIQKHQGVLLVNVFSSADGFPDHPEHAARSLTIPVPSSGDSTQDFKVEGLETGTTAVSLFHDENSNGKLDTGIFGIPKERLGFSQNPRLGTHAPGFDECQFELPNSGTTIEIQLKHY